jgi:predicted  nucleic acid-binding Zn-ribbon protein
MRGCAIALLVSVCSPLAAQATEQSQTLHANPIRKVVTMLQSMTKKVEAEGEKQKSLYEKYMCYCKTSGGELSKSISDAGTKIPELESSIKEGESKKVQLDEEIKQHQADRATAKAAMSEATAIREKEAAAYAKASSEDQANIAATSGAITAIEKGLGLAFLQTTAARLLQRVVQEAGDLQDSDKESLVSFLSGDSSAPGTHEIVGILKTMLDEMNQDFAEEKATEEAAIKAYELLMAAKTKEVNALTKAIEEKMTRVGELAVEIVQMKNDLGDTAEALIEDKKFLADMQKNCATKSSEYEEIVKTRNEELLALADTIKVLNDDDALELFKKTLPGASSFVQVQVTTSALRLRALNAIRRSRRSSRNPHLDLIALAIQGKKIGFEGVIKMIDEMVATLKAEQVDDDSKKEYCAVQFDQSEDKKKALERKIKDLTSVIADAKDGIVALEDEIEALTASIKALDKSVAEATEQRKAEHEDFVELMASDSAAKEVLGFAKNRLNKFYNPKLYKPPPKRELSEEERITVSMGGTLAPTAAPGGIAGTGIAVLAEVSDHSQNGDAAKPPPPPEAPGAYEKKSEESTGVIAMIDILIKDLDKEMTVAETEEKDAQGDYEQLMKDSAEKRAEDAKTLANKEATLAELQSSLEKATEGKKSSVKELGATLQYIHSLHTDCDWLLQYFDVRKTARSDEIDALGKAKAVLSGADYSLVQVRSSRKFLRRS